MDNCSHVDNCSHMSIYVSMIELCVLRNKTGIYTCTLIVHYHIIIPVISMATLSVCCGTCNEQYSKRESESVVVGFMGVT